MRAFKCAQIGLYSSVCGFRHRGWKSHLYGSVTSVLSDSGAKTSLTWRTHTHLSTLPPAQTQNPQKQKPAQSLHRGFASVLRSLCVQIWKKSSQSVIQIFTLSSQVKEENLHNTEPFYPFFFLSLPQSIKANRLLHNFSGVIDLHVQESLVNSSWCFANKCNSTWSVEWIWKEHMKSNNSASPECECCSKELKTSTLSQTQPQRCCKWAHEWWVFPAN